MADSFKRPAHGTNGHVPHQAPEIDRGTDLFEMLTGDPGVGVAIVSSEGRTLFCNDAMARIFHGPEATGAKYSNLEWRGQFPEEWIRERVEMLKQLEGSDHPVLMRSIWRGVQHLSLVRRLPHAEGAGRFLVVAREVEGSHPTELSSTKAEVRESRVVSLGRLDALTTRELEVLALLSQGMAIKEIAATLGLAPKTVENQRASIGRKLSESDRVRLAVIARKAGLRPEDATRTRIRPVGESGRGNRAG